MTGTFSQETVVSGVVPSLRIDVLGARAFKVSRAWFARGVASGNVFVGGEKAGKSQSLAPGVRVRAKGLGSFEVLSVDGSTRKGNLKVSLKVSRESGD